MDRKSFIGWVTALSAFLSGKKSVAKTAQPPTVTEEPPVISGKRRIRYNQGTDLQPRFELACEEYFYDSSQLGLQGYTGLWVGRPKLYTKPDAALYASTPYVEYSDGVKIFNIGFSVFGVGPDGGQFLDIAPPVDPDAEEEPLILDSFAGRLDFYFWQGVERLERATEDVVQSP